MLSNKLTFSLASLVVLLAFAFGAMPVMGHESTTHNNGNAGHPTIEITEDTAGYTTVNPKARDNFRVRIAAKVNGSTASNLFDSGDVIVRHNTPAQSEVTVRGFFSDGTPVDLPTPSALVRVTNAAPHRHEWTFSLDITNNAIRRLKVTIVADAVNGNRDGALGGNEATSVDFDDLPPVLNLSAAFTPAPVAKKDSSGNAIPGRYTVTLRFSNDSDVLTDPTPAPTTSDIEPTVMGAAFAVDASGNAIRTSTGLSTDSTGVYTQDYQLAFGVTSATLKLIDGYATNAPSVHLPPVTEPDATAEIDITAHDAAERTFRIQVTFARGNKSDGTAGSPVKVKTGDASDAFLQRTLEIKDASGGDSLIEAVERGRDNSYTALLTYDALSTLPLTVKLVSKPNSDPAKVEYYKDTSDPTMDATATVEAETDTMPPVTDTTPPALIGQVIGAPDATTGAVMVTLTFSEALKAAPTVTHAASTGLAGTYAVSTATAATAPNSYTVTVTPTAATTANIPAGTVTLTVSATDAADNALAAGTTVSVPLAARTAQTTDDDDDDGTGDQMAPTSTTLGPNGYAVLVHPGALEDHHGIDADVKTISLSNMKNLAEFLDDGGTISLIGPSTASVKITEIMWGTDASLAADDVPIKFSQWIEIYNTTSTAIAVDFGTGGGWSVEFDDTYETGTGAVDRVSNLGNPGYWEAKGSSGRTVSTENADAKSLVSMYRKLKQINNPAHDDHGVDDGSPHRAGTWVASVKPRRNLSGMRVGTPGANPSVRIQDATAPTQQVIINEIGNASGDSNDWVELLNTTGSEINLKKWELNVVKAGSSGPAETQLVSFPDNDNTKLPANGILLITNTSPSDPDNDLAAGVEINKSADDQVKTGVSSLYYVDSNLTLPDSGQYNLILRNANDKEGASSHVVDNGGTYFGAKNDGSINTEVWPLQATAKGHDNVIDGTGDEAFQAGRVYQRNAKNSGIGEKHWKKVGFTGVGYDRVAKKSDENGGTPGYANNALKEKIADISDAEVTISEIMFDAGSGRRNIAQWIELYNASMTQAVNLNGWKLEFQNARDANLDARLNATITLGAMTIAPNQTVLIVSTSGLNSGSDEFPSTRVVNLWTTHRDDLEMETRNDTVLSGIGFYLELTDKDGKLVDEVGNLDGNRRTADAPAWELPASSEEGRRSSIIRRYEDDVASDGMTSAGWISASNTQLAYAISHTYYGNADDLGTPGFRGGGPLPVSLSSFRPERDKATGQVVVRWITQSELNNAGFNILRSETKTGEFKVVNTKGIIPGHGTTSEKHVYTWTDTSAKPNVVYYYQIEDVSLDGNRTTLRTTHLRGNVNAAGKLTTTWGDLKTQN